MDYFFLGIIDIFLNQCLFLAAHKLSLSVKQNRIRGKPHSVDSPSINRTNVKSICVGTDCFVQGLFRVAFGYILEPWGISRLDLRNKVFINSRH